MNKQLIFTSIAALTLLFASCGSRRTVSTDNSQAGSLHTAVTDAQHIGSSVSEIIMLAGREDESRFKVEIFAGKEMLIDCNHHGLAGEFEERVLDSGETALFFHSTGNVFSTQMACLDDTRRLAFVAAQPHMMRYNSAAPIVVHAPQGISVRHRIWEAGTTNPFPPTPRYANTHVLSAFPTEKASFQRHVLLLTEILDTQERKVEIIVGQMAYVDCNIHILGGTFSTETVDGWGFDYLVFHSDGIMASTRMACIEPPVFSFVAASQTEFVRYNIQMPIVVFAPIGFEVRYRVWEAAGM